MLKNGGGVIVNNVFIFGLVGSFNLLIYCVSKYGVIGLIKVVVLE